MNDQPIDRDLYDEVMGEVSKLIADLTLSPDTYHVATLVAENTAKIAARIAAERVPVSDEELLETYLTARYAYGWDDSPGQKDSYLAGIRAVRAALGPSLPVGDHAQAIYDVLANAPVSNFTSLLGPNEREEIKRHADALAAETSMPVRDQGLYQATIKQMDEETPEEWQWGFVSGAKVASRIAAERLSPNGDLRERIRRAIYDAIVVKRTGHLFPLRDPNNLPSFDEYTEQQLEICGLAADAVIAVIRTRWRESQ